jgi:hypothetical protein
VEEECHRARHEDRQRTIRNDPEAAVPAKPEGSKLAPESHVRASIDSLNPETQKLMRSVRSAIRKRFPTLNELAYTYATSFVISYSPTANGIDGIVAIAARADGVRLYFGQGVQLADPKGLLQGTGKQTRFVHVETASQLAHPDMEVFFAMAIAQSKVPVPSEGPGTVIIKTDGTQQRTRRTPTK